MKRKSNVVVIAVIIVFGIIISSLIYFNFNSVPEPDTLSVRDCISDVDCIPNPSECHTQICINKKFSSSFKAPEACTEMFFCSAAYTPEDCVCVNNACIDKNLENGSDKCQINYQL